MAAQAQKPDECAEDKTPLFQMTGPRGSEAPQRGTVQLLHSGQRRVGPPGQYVCVRSGRSEARREHPCLGLAATRDRIVSLRQQADIRRS